MYDIMNLSIALGKAPNGGWQWLLLLILEYVPIFTLTPRFILNIRELYTHDGQGRLGEGIDTGFGLSSSGRGAVGTAMVFANAEQNEGSDDTEEIRMEDRATP